MITLLLVTLSLVKPVFGQQVVRKEFDEVNTDKPEVQTTIVDGHNDHRRNVDPPASNMLEMGWDNDIAKYAADYASQCTCNHSSLAYRTKNGIYYGENILHSEKCVSWVTTTDYWDAEKKDFVFDKAPSPDATIGHYTQMVWFASNKCGCAVAQCPNTKCPYFYVCWYYRVGNLKERLYKPYDKGAACGKCKGKDQCKNKLCQVACSMRNTHTLSNCEYVRKHEACSSYNASCEASCNCPTGEIYQ